jgi:K+-sensing histidine kinase KdpD
MLHEFLTTNREELVRRCRAKVVKRHAPTPTALELEDGTPLFLDQLIGALRKELRAPKLSGRNGTVSLAARAAGDRILIDVEDECGGLPDGTVEELLSISRRAVQANDGSLDVRNLAGKGCAFTIDLPRSGGN